MTSEFQGQVPVMSSYSYLWEFIEKRIQVFINHCCGTKQKRATITVEMTTEFSGQVCIAYKIASGTVMVTLDQNY